METLAELLDAARIRLKSHAAGHTEHVRCPKCDGGDRTHEISLSVTIDADGEGFAAICHRGSCGWKDGRRTRKVRFSPKPTRVYKAPPPATPSQQSNRPIWLYEFFAERNIGAKTVDTFGLYAVERNFPDPVGRSRCIVFPYQLAGEVVNRKYRPHPAKNPMLQEVDALPTMFNIDRATNNPEEIVIVEGECDVLALYECGIRHAITLKDGAPAVAQAETDPNAKRFEALKTHAEVLEKAKRIVLAGDQDAPGLALREELVRRLGRHRCYLVEWPEGCKDACDVLRLRGLEAVLEALRLAEPYPIDGIQYVRPTTLLALRKLPAPTTMTTGAYATDVILKLPTEGRLIIVTGFPGAGKTTWVRFVMVHTAQHHHRRWAVFSPEMQPWEQFIAECAEVWAGKPFRPVYGTDSMSDEEVEKAAVWLSDKVNMLVCDAEDQAPTVEWIIERARACVLRDAVTDLVIDPWNEIDHSRSMNMTETEYIGRQLQRLKAFGLRHGCNIWIIAHPGKPQPNKNGEKKGGPPGPYDISSSAHWFNRADLGITVHSSAADTAEVHLWKSRFVRRWGKRGANAVLDFDVLTGRYDTPRTAVDDGLPKSWVD